jgi:hypothetical protein
MRRPELSGLLLPASGEKVGMRGRIRESLTKDVWKRGGAPPPPPPPPGGGAGARGLSAW